MVTRSHLRGKYQASFGGAYHTGQGLAIVCFISLVAHGLFFVGLILLQGFEFSKPLPRSFQVDLVSFVPGPVGGKGELSPVPEPPTAIPEPAQPEAAEVAVESAPEPDPVKPPPEPIEAIKPDISLKTKPKNLKELVAEKEKKKPEEKPVQEEKPKPQKDPKETEEALKKAREKIAKKLAEQNQLSDALSRMKAAVETKGQVSETPKVNQGDALGQGTGPGAGTGTGVGRQGYEPIDMYKLLLQSAIEQNWVFNDMMARMDQNLECRILIKILRNGEIRDIDYETRSGNRYLDESAIKAITRANPLPHLPKGMNSYDVVVIFTPKGLK